MSVFDAVAGGLAQAVFPEGGLTRDGKLQPPKFGLIGYMVAGFDAKAARDAGATRYCMGAAWREPKDRDMAPIIEMVKGVKALGMEACMTLGMLTAEQARRLKEGGLDYYNHNLDTAPEFYGNIISTRTQNDRHDTLDKVRAAAGELSYLLDYRPASGKVVNLFRE